jgi:hypothetical protein
MLVAGDGNHAAILDADLNVASRPAEPAGGFVPYDIAAGIAGIDDGQGEGTVWPANRSRSCSHSGPF